MILVRPLRTPAKIGLILRDKYGVPRTRIFGMRVVDILKENKVDYESDKKIVDKKVDKLKGHISKNKHDYSASRALTKRLWDVYKLEKKG